MESKAEEIKLKCHSCESENVDTYLGDYLVVGYGEENNLSILRHHVGYQFKIEYPGEGIVECNYADIKTLVCLDCGDCKKFLDEENLLRLKSMKVFIEDYNKVTKKG